MNKDKALRLALETLENNKRTHHYCEDVWYSCPKHEDGCANDAEGDECNCGADKANAEIDATIAAIKQVMEQPEPEPVTDEENEKFSRDVSNYAGSDPEATKYALEEFIKNRTSPPQRQPLTNEQIMSLCAAEWASHPIEVARAIEAAHGIGEKK